MYKLFLSEKQLQELVTLAYPNAMDHLIILLGINTLFRIGDLVNLRQSDVINHDCTPTSVVVCKTQKTGMVMSVQLREDTRSAISRRFHTVRDTSGWVFPSRYIYRAPRPHITIQGAERMLQRYFRRMGIEDHLIFRNAFHTIRRSVAAIIRKKTGSLEAAMMALGHRRITTTLAYLDYGVFMNAAIDAVQDMDLGSSLHV